VSRDDCHTSALETDAAHLVSLDAGDLFAASRLYNARPVLSEVYSDDGTMGSYNATVLMKASECDSTTTMASLKGKNACSTGYGKTAGWQTPIGLMLDNGVMPIVNDDCTANNDAESAAAFFGGMCAPGAPEAAPANKAVADKLCSACEQGGDGFCEKGADKYSDYDGALRCLAEGAGDVAFIKHTTLGDAATSSAWFIDAGHSVDEFRYLCPMGGCVTEEELKERPQCAWAVVPAHAVIVNPSLVGNDVVEDVQGAFAAAALDERFKKLFFKNNAVDPPVVNTGDLVFKGDTYSLAPVYTDMRTYLGEMYTVFREMEDLNNLGCGGTDDHLTGQAVVARSSSDDIPGWGVAVIVLVTLVIMAMCGLVCCMVAKERAGSPMFSKMMADTV